MSNYCEECYKKQEEIERLKEENKKLKSNLVRQASTIFTLEKSSNDLSQCANKLYKTLQEIRDILAERIEWTGIPNNAEIEIIDKINEFIGAE